MLNVGADAEMCNAVRDVLLPLSLPLSLYVSVSLSLRLCVSVTLSRSRFLSLIPVSVCLSVCAHSMYLYYHAVHVSSSSLRTEGADAADAGGAGQQHAARQAALKDHCGTCQGQQRGGWGRRR